MSNDLESVRDAAIKASHAGIAEFGNSMQDTHGASDMEDVSLSMIIFQLEVFQAAVTAVAFKTGDSVEDCWVRMKSLLGESLDSVEDRAAPRILHNIKRMEALSDDRLDLEDVPEKVKADVVNILDALAKNSKK